MVTSLSGDGRLFLIPGKDNINRKVIVIQGIDSEADCDDISKSRGEGNYRYPQTYPIYQLAGYGDDNLATRANTVAYYIQQENWETKNDPGFIDAKDVLTFSYADAYADCSTGMIYRSGQLPSTSGFYGVDC